MADRIGSPPFLSVNATVPVTLPPDNAPAFVKQSHQSKILAAMRAEAEALQKLYTYLSDYVECSVPIGDKKYTVLAKNILPGSASTTPWAVSFISDTEISLTVPPCYFQQGTGDPQPVITIGGLNVDYLIPSNNTLTVPSGLSYLVMQVSVDDTDVNGLITTAVEIIALDQTAYDALVNTLTDRYIPLRAINTTTQETSLPWQTYGVRTVRLGDRNFAQNMFWYSF